MVSLERGVLNKHLNDSGRTNSNSNLRPSEQLAAYASQFESLKNQVQREQRDRSVLKQRMGRL